MPETKTRPTLGSTLPSVPELPGLTLPGVAGKMPLPIGTVLTPNEKNVLKNFGWKEGDPIPSDLPRVIAQAKKESEAAVKQGFPGAQDLKQPTAVDFKSLPEHRRKEIEAALASAKAIGFDAPRPAPFQPGGPGVTEAIQQAAHPRLEIVDTSRPAEPKTPPAAAPQPKVEVAEVDKVTYFNRKLGARFYKTYPLFAGRLKVTFGDLTSAQSQAAYKQITKDRLNDPSLTASLRLNLYRFMLSLQTISVDGDIPIDVAGAVEDYLKTCDTGLATLCDELVKIEPLNTEAVWQAVYSAHGRFQDLCVKLEDLAADPDFTLPGGSRS